MQISKDSSVRLSIATLLAVLIWMGGASWKVFGYVQTIAANTMAIQEVAKSLKVGRLADEIGDLKRERRGLKRDLRKDPENDILPEQIDEVEDELEDKTDKLKCVIKDIEICD